MVIRRPVVLPAAFHPSFCREETNCRFCNAAYSDWKQNFTPPLGPDSGTPKRPATPIMAIFFEGQTHRIKVRSSRM